MHINQVADKLILIKTKDDRLLSVTFTIKCDNFTPTSESYKNKKLRPTETQYSL